ncbi:MAG: aminopeptidase, partial [Pyramidobacter sp.]|nr:aminopeptidase [Pyramidobacter sp.]
VGEALERSVLLSADVTVGYDPNYAAAFEANNAARLGSGPVLMKYAGARGKAGANDASAELMAFVRDIFDEAGVTWQIGGMGKIDLGGGGTIAPYASKYGMQVLDCGVALLSMHAPYELASKADIYETYRGYAAFLSSASEMKKYL